MEILFQYFSAELMYALSWTCINAIGQGVLVAMVVMILLMTLKQLDAGQRYLIAFGGLVISFTLSVITFINHLQGIQINSHHIESLLVASELEKGNGGVIESVGLLGQITYFINSNIDLISLLWICGIFFFTLRLVFGFAIVQYVKNGARPLTSEWQDMLTNLKQKNGYQKIIRFCESSSTHIPMVIGSLKPVILFPVGMVNQMTTQEVEAILAHELAHILRHDYLMNMIQSLIEILLFFSPGIWWLSKIIRTERERACDDKAIKMINGNAIHFAKALYTLEHNTQLKPALAMGLFSNKKELLNRINRILMKAPQNKLFSEKLFFSFLMMGTMIFFSAKNPEPIIDTQEDSSIDISESFGNSLDQDTIKPEAIKFSSEDSDIDLRVKDGEVIQMKIDGEDVSKEEIERMINGKGNLKITIDTSIIISSDDGEEEVIGLFNSNDLKKSIFKILSASEDGEFEFIGDTSRFLKMDFSHDFEWNDDEDSFNVNIIGEDDDITNIDIEEGEEVVTIKIESDHDEDSFTLRIDEESMQMFGDDDVSINLNWNEIGNAFEDAFENSWDKNTMKKLFLKGRDMGLIEGDEKEVAEKFEIFSRELSKEMEKAAKSSKSELKQEQKELKSFFKDLDINESKIEQLLEDFGAELRKEGKDIQSFIHSLDINEEEFEEFFEDIEEEFEDAEIKIFQMESDLEDIFDDMEDREWVRPEQKIDQKKLKKQLLKDGLIDNEHRFSFLLKKGKMKVNGKTQSDEMARRYQKFFHLWSGNEWDSESTIKMKVKKNSSKLSITI